mmetsp:Transcript_7241/g.9201  ORF Transcript_7241/g.9201 Transcript_7241/m.9201 type:complete len:368 (+) Transcript_7241:253-1356(+)
MNKSIFITFCISSILLITSTNLITITQFTNLFQPNLLEGKNVEDNKDHTKLIWLLSFPNSGNSFTTQMFRAYTNMATATNYGEEHINEHGQNILIGDGDEYKNGPFLAITSSKKSHDVGKFVLTKTHCGGRCGRCHPKFYVESIQSFKEDCLAARRALNLTNGTVVYEKVSYDENLVGKAIHIIRDPLDNIVSRYHLFLKMREKKGTVIELEQIYSNDKKGFRKWCKERDEAYVDELKEIVGMHVYDLLKPIPCHADFYRYVQWHNLAFEVISNMEIPSIVLHYENYDSDFQDTKNQIIRFLETKEVQVEEKKKNNVSFISGKRYTSYFSEGERNDIFYLLKQLGSAKAKIQFQRYFDQEFDKIIFK